ncbi:MAG: 2-hydroxyacid dehydrogenase [Silicimonas sp.]|nr:2-hydroxyacid dehydrogenase [Silicimonas sp.]
MADRPALLQIGKVLPTMATRLDAGFEVTVLPEGDADFLAARGGEFTAVATMKGISDEVMAALPNLKIIASFGVGYDSINADAAAERGIIVTHTPDVLNDEVADTAIMLWLAVSKELVPSEAWARSGDWEAKGAYPLTRSVRGRKVGILGLGRIGQTIAEMCQLFGNEVVYHTRSEKDVPYQYYGNLVEMARDVDVIFVITPGGAATNKLVNAQVMEALGPEGILINVARGTVVDETAMIAALESGKLGAAGLDVFEAEPKIPEALKRLKNVVLVPHIGSATVETRDAMGALVCDNLDRWRENGGAVTPVPECKHLVT